MKINLNLQKQSSQQISNSHNSLSDKVKSQAIQHHMFFSPLSPLRYDDLRFTLTQVIDGGRNASGEWLKHGKDTEYNVISCS